MATILFGINPLCCFLLARLVGASFERPSSRGHRYASHNETRRGPTSDRRSDACTTRTPRTAVVSVLVSVGTAGARGPVPELMWPWEHLAIGYLAYSFLVRVTEGRSPSTGGTIALAVGTQFPDLIDKPLGWGTTLLPSGQSLAHSLLFAIPLLVVLLGIGLAIGRSSSALAFAVGYLAHLPGDVVYAAMLGGELNFGFLLWPVIPAAESQHAMLGYVQELFVQFAAALATPLGAVYLLFEVLLVLGTLAVWLLDGTPGLPGRFGTTGGDPT